ncbi:MAG: glycosyltransferase [Dongiaceae bacterium]
MARSTVIVAPRERFSSVVESLESLFATVPATVPVVVVEGCSPAPVRAALTALQARRPFDLVSLDWYVTPHEARNIAFERVETEFVVFADNDMIYEPNWLDHLEANADRNRADAVAPLICIGPPMATKAHHAGGTLIVEDGKKRPQISEKHRHMNDPIESVTAATAPETNEVTEFHCFLARTEFVRGLGPLDERLITREQMDFALRTALAGGKITFERQAIVTYAAKTAVDLEDLPYYLFRWSHRLAAQSVRAFQQVWGVELDEHNILRLWIERHRLRAMMSAFPKELKKLGKDEFEASFAPKIEQALTDAAFATRDKARKLRVPPPPNPTAIVAYLATKRQAPASGVVPTAVTNPVRVPQAGDALRILPNPEWRERPMLVAGMATMPSRQATVRVAMASILSQVDRLFLFLDRFEGEVDIRHPKIVVLRSQEFGDLRANGKLLGLTMCSGPTRYFTVDDDIRYPPDYVTRMNAQLDALPRETVLGVHGSRLRPPVRSYRDDRESLHRSMLRAEHEPVDVIGTDSAAFDMRALNFDVRRWDSVNMVDLNFAIECAKRGLQRLLATRKRYWVEALSENQPDSIYAKLKQDDSHQTVLANALLKLGPPAATLPRVDGERSDDAAVAS